MGYRFQECNDCARELRLSWAVSDELKKNVLGSRASTKIFCLECFLKQAGDKSIHITLDEITFYGIVMGGKIIKESENEQAKTM